MRYPQHRGSVKSSILVKKKKKKSISLRDFVKSWYCEHPKIYKDEDLSKLISCMYCSSNLAIVYLSWKHKIWLNSTRLWWSVRVWSSCREPALWFTQLGRMESALHRQPPELFVMSSQSISGAVFGKRVSCQVGLHWHDSDGPPRAAYGPWLLHSRHWCVVKRSVPATLSPAVLSFSLLLVMLHW